MNHAGGVVIEDPEGIEVFLAVVEGASEEPGSTDG